MDEPSIELIPADQVAAMLNSDHAIFLTPVDFRTIKTTHYGKLPAVVLDFPPMEAKVVDGTLTVERYGIGKEIEGVEVGLFASMKTNIGLVVAWLKDAPPGFVELAMKQFAFAFDDRARSGVPIPYVCTGPMWHFGDKGIYFPSEAETDDIDWATKRGKKLGRNELCFCGSGLKFKRCHGG